MRLFFGIQLIIFCVVLCSCGDTSCKSSLDLNYHGIDTTLLNKSLYAVSELDTIEMLISEPPRIKLSDSVSSARVVVYDECEVGVYLSYDIRYKGGYDFVILSFIGDEQDLGYFNYEIYLPNLDDFKIKTTKFSDIDTLIEIPKHELSGGLIAKLRIEDGYLKKFSGYNRP